MFKDKLCDVIFFLDLKIGVGIVEEEDLQFSSVVWVDYSCSDVDGRFEGQS